MYSKLPFPVSMENLPRHRQVFCLSLRFGCVVTALASIIWAVLGLAVCGAAFGLDSAGTEEARAAVSDDNRSPVSLALLVATTLTYIVTFILSVALLIGTIKKSLRLIKPWLVWSSVQVTVSLMLFVLVVAAHGAHSMPEDVLLTYLVHILTLMIRIYMLILVSSYFRQVEEEQDETQRLHQLLGKEAWYSTTDA